MNWQGWYSLSSISNWFTFWMDIWSIMSFGLVPFDTFLTMFCRFKQVSTLQRSFLCFCGFDGSFSLRAHFHFHSVISKGDSRNSKSCLTMYMFGILLYKMRIADTYTCLYLTCGWNRISWFDKGMQRWKDVEKQPPTATYVEAHKSKNRRGYITFISVNCLSRPLAQRWSQPGWHLFSHGR